MLGGQLGNHTRHESLESRVRGKLAGAVRRGACATKAEGGLDVEDRTQRMLVASEMEVGPPEPPCRGRLQTTTSCSRQKLGW